MLADFYIPMHSNDMKIAVQKNHLVGQILYSSFVLSKKNGVEVNRQNSANSAAIPEYPDFNSEIYDIGGVMDAPPPIPARKNRRPPTEHAEIRQLSLTSMSSYGV